MLVLRAIMALAAMSVQGPAWLLLPQPAGAAAPARSAGRVEYAAQALPDWFVAAPATGQLAASADDDAGEAPNASMVADIAPGALPAWFTPATGSLAVGAPAQLDPVAPGADDTGHHTIYPNQITVTVSPDTINQCDPLTVSVIAVNDAVTTTGVSVVVAAPPGLSPSPQVFNIPSVAPNATLSLTAVFSSVCSAVSGQIIVTLTQDSYPPIVKFAEYVVNPGAITVLKEPAIAQAALGDVVTWTVYVNNTGYGTVYNARVTDTLGPGLQWVAGLTSTSFVSIPVGQSRSFTIAAQVMSCAGLDNLAVATWGCEGQTCQAPQQAKASIDLRPRFPNLDYALPAFDLPYCAGFGVFTIPITNTGDGAAISPTLAATFAPFQVSVAAPASYSGGAFQLPDIPPGQTHTLVFTLTAPANICAAARQGEFNFDLQYQDACHFPYTEIPQMTSWQMSNAPGELSVSKTMPPAIYRGQPITSVVTVNASGITGNIIVTDQAPAGLIVLDPAGGVTVTQGGNTFITWTLSGSAVLTPVFAIVDAPQGCALCGLPVTNIITATASDCQNCLQTATARATTQIQCDEPEARGSKSVSGPAEVCAASALTFTNVYTFGSAFVVTPTWSSLIFTESLAYQTYTPGLATVWVGNGPISCSATFSEAVVGSALVISNITPPCNPDIAGATLIITYTTNVSETSACQDFTWYDWSYLDLGVAGNGFCAADGVLEQGALVETQAPRMTLAATGLPPNVASCGVYTLTLTAQRTSTVGAYDAVIDVPTTTYAVLDVLGFGGAQPVLTQTDALGYHWFYADAFTSAVTATVLLRVQLRCASGPAPFQAAVHYDSLCADNDVYRQSCSAGGTLAAPPAYGPLSLLTKFPEIIYAQGDLVTWTLIAKNTGAGPAYSVVLTDQLGSGLQFVTATITSSLGATSGIGMITSTHLVTWLIPAVQPKETLTIRYTAEIIGCNDLTNRLLQTQGCLGQTCQASGPIVSVVELPPTVLLNTNQTLSPIDTCFTRTVTMTVRNAGLLSVYDAVLTETLPAGLSYVMGSTEVSTDTIQWQAGPDPAISGLSLGWSAANGAPLDALLSRVRPGETVYVRFVVRATCAFDGGQLRVQTAYRDTCGNPYLTDSSFFLMTARKADISIDKIGQNLSRTSPSNTYLYAEPGETLVFTVTVANGPAAAPAQLLVVTDTLPANLILITATPGFTGALPGDLGGVLTWSIPLLNPNQSVALTLTTVVSAPNGCAITDTINTAQVSWGCPDGCRLSLPAQTVRVRTRPVFDQPGIGTSIAPAALNVCGGVVTVTLNNDGPPAYNVALTNTLPTGYVLSGAILASTPPSSVVDLGGTVVYTWGVLPSGLTTLTLELRNNTVSGACVVPSGAFSAVLRYDDDTPDCPDTASYTASASLTLTVLTPVLTLDKAPTSQVGVAGQTVTWTVRLTNTGSGAAFNVVITDVAGSTFVSLTASNGGVVSGNIITWSLPSLAPGGVFTSLVTAVVTSSGANRNVITATSACGSGCVSAAASDIAYVTLGDVFDKGPALQTATVGSLLVFTFTFYSSDVENIFESVILTDALPAGLGYVSAALTYTWDIDGDQGGPFTVSNAPPGSAPALYNAGNVVWNLGTLTGALSIDGVLTAVVQNIPAVFDGAALTNTLRMSLLDDGQTTVLSDTSPVAVQEPLLHLGKTATTATGCDATLMQDHFNRASASPPAGWTAIAGTWNNANGVAQRTGGAATNAILARSSFAASEFSYSALVWASDTTSSRGIVFRHTPNNYYLLRLRQNDGGTNLELQKVTAGTFAQLAVTTTFAPITNRWYHLEAQVSEVAGGLRIRAYVDGQLYFDVVDNTPHGAGSVGFYANNCAAGACLFDDALVTRIHRAGCFVGAGDLLTFTLTISNQSRWPGFDLLVTDTLPNGLSLVTYTLTGNAPVSSLVLAQPAPIPGATGVLTWLIDHLTPTVPYSPLQHTALTLTIVTRVADWITANTTLLNEAALRYDAWLSDTQPTTITRPYNGGSHAAGAQTVNPGIRKEVVFTPPPTATLGALVTYTLLVPASPISATLYAVTVTDALDAGHIPPRLQLSGVIDGPDGTVFISGSAFTVTYPAIPAGEQRHITVTAALSSPLGALAGQVITNVAIMQHEAGGPAPSNETQIVVAEPALTLVKASDPPTSSTVGAGQTLTYSVSITNATSATVSAAYGLRFSDTLPPALRTVPPDVFSLTLDGSPIPSASYTMTWDALSGALLITFSLDLALPPGSVLQVRYRVAVADEAPAGVDVVNQAALRWSSLPPTGSDAIRHYGPISDTTNVHLGYPTLQIVKSFTPALTQAGEWLTYTLHVTAGGVVSATGVVVTDAVPFNTTYVACSPAPCGVSGAVVSWTLGVLSIGESRQVTLVVAVNSPLPNGTLLTNTGYVTSTEGVTDTDTVTTPVGSLPQLSLVKSSLDPNGAPVRPGDVLSYTIVVVNLGNATASNVTVSDVAPANTTYVPGSIAGGDSASDAASPLLIWGINALLPNTPVTLSFAVTVNLPLTNGLTLVNSAVVTSTETPTPTSAIVTDSLVSGHTLAIHKRASPSAVEAGAWLTCTIVYTLTGDEPVDGIVISDTTPDHTTFVSASPAPSSDPGAGNAGAIVWQFGPPPLLPPASGVTQVTGVLTVVLQVNRPLISGTQIVNTAFLSDTTGLTDTHTVTTPVSSSHALDVSKHVEPAGPAQAGTLLTYTLRYTVTGNQPALGVLLTDTLPPSVTLQSCAPACVVSGQTLTWSLGALDPITTSAVQVVVRVNSNTPSGTLLLNLAAIGDSSGLTDTDQITTPVVVEAQIRLSKSVAPAVAAPGGMLTYTLLVTNTGPGDAQNVVVTDTLPALLNLVGADPAPAGVSGGSGSPTHITWTLGALPAGASAMLTVTAQVSNLAPAGAILTNTAIVTTSTPGDDPLDNTGTVTTPVTATAELVLRKHNSAETGGPAVVVPGAPLTYTLIVTNLGPHPAWNVIVTDALPVGIIYQSATPAPDHVAGSVLRWSLGILAPGQSVSITVRVTVSPAVMLTVPLTNTAVTTTDTPGDNPSNNTDDSPVTPIGPSVAIRKTLVGADLDDVAPNYVTFTIRITNTGPSAIARLPVEDEFDTDLLSYTLAVPAPDDVSPGLLVWDDLTAPAPHGFGSPLAPGHSVVITVTFRVISDIVTTVNVARVREGGRDVYDNLTNMPEDDAEVINVPTAVTLRLFAVAGVHQLDVRLIWETETEQDNFQFNLYRSAVNAPAQAVLVGSVPAAMSGALGASYAVTDTVPAPGVWWYWLADVDTSGRETMHQPPVQARVGSVPYRAWLPVVRAE